MSKVTAEPDSGASATGGRIWRAPNEHLTSKVAARSSLRRTIFLVSLLVVACALPLLLSQVGVFTSPIYFMIYGMVVAFSSVLVVALFQSSTATQYSIQIAVVLGLLVVGMSIALGGMVTMLTGNASKNIPPTEWLTEETAELTGSNGWDLLTSKKNDAGEVSAVVMETESRVAVLTLTKSGDDWSAKLVSNTEVTSNE